MMYITLTPKCPEELVVKLSYDLSANFRAVYHSLWLSVSIPGPAASTRPGNLSEMQILMLIQDHGNQKLWVWDPEIFVSISTLGGSDAHQV